MIINERQIVAIIKQEIKRQGLTENSLAKKSGITQTTINEYLSGKTSIRTKGLLCLLNTLGIQQLLSINGNVVQTKNKCLPCFKKTNIKDSLSTELRNRIEQYKSDKSEDKPKFTIDLIIQYLEESYDKIATI